MILLQFYSAYTVIIIFTGLYINLYRHWNGVYKDMTNGYHVLTFISELILENNNFPALNSKERVQEQRGRNWRNLGTQSEKTEKKM